MTDISAVTRIQIQTDLGLYNFWSDRWEVDIRDDSRTLYLRGRGEGSHARTQRDIEAQATVTDADQSDTSS